MSYKGAFILLMGFAVVFTVTYFIKRSSYMQKWLSNPTNIYFDKRSHDLGTIPEQKAANVYFIFTNKGLADLKIDRIETRCGCTASNWPTTQIKPDQKDSILVQYDAEQEGFFLKEVYVFSNAESSPDLLTIKGTVTPLDQ